MTRKNEKQPNRKKKTKKRKYKDVSASGNGFGIGKPPAPGPHGKPGRPPNTSGRPLTHYLKQALQECCEETGQPFGEKLIEMAVQEAVGGNYKFFKEIYDRVEGKVPEAETAEQGDHVIIRKGARTRVQIEPAANSDEED